MRKQYKCIKDFDVVRYNGDGIIIPNEQKRIRAGDTYTLDENSCTILRANAHLDGEDGSWLELPESQLDEFFKQIVEI